jgi:hypothetical protein
MSKFITKCQQKVSFGNQIVNFKSRKSIGGLFTKIHHMINISTVSIMGFILLNLSSFNLFLVQSKFKAEKSTITF